MVQEGCRWCRRAAGGAGGLQVVLVGCRRCWSAAGGAVGGGGAKCFPVPLPSKASLAHAPDRSVAATLHRHGSGGRGFTSRSGARLSLSRRGAVLVRLGPCLQAYPWVGLARSSGHGGSAAHAPRRRVPVVGHYLCRIVGGSH